MLATEEGTWSDANARRTLFIQVTGAQTFQAAQSYAEKSYLRSLFKLPTGDMDLDGMPQADNEEDAMALAAPAKRKSSSASKKDGTDKRFNEIKTMIVDRTGQREALIRLRSELALEWGEMPARWADLLNDEYEDALGACREAAE